MSNRAKTIVGLAITLAAAVLMLVGVVAIGWGVAFGMIGIGFIAAAGAAKTTSPAQADRVE